MIVEIINSYADNFLPLSPSPCFGGAERKSAPPSGEKRILEIGRESDMIQLSAKVRSGYRLTK